MSDVTIEVNSELIEWTYNLHRDGSGQWTLVVQGHYLPLDVRVSRQITMSQRRDVTFTQAAQNVEMYLPGARRDIQQDLAERGAKIAKAALGAIKATESN